MDGEVMPPSSTEGICGYPGCLALLARMETKLDLIVGTDGASGRLANLETRIGKIEKLGWLLIGGGTLALTVVNLITPMKQLFTGS